MTPRPPLSRAATDLLAADDGHARPPSPEVDDAAIARIADAIEASARARARRKWALGGAALAAVAAGAALLLGRPTPPEPGAGGARPRTLEARVSTTDGTVTLARASSTLSVRSETLRPNDRLATADGAADVTVSTGTHIVLEGNSDLTVVEQGLLEMYSLSRGAVRARVAKLEGAERFLVHTPDAEVEVRGTEFRISLVPPDPACGGGITTRLEVAEGHVVVRTHQAEAHVLRGESWPPGCAKATAATAIATSASAAPIAGDSSAAAPSPVASLSVAPGAVSTGSARGASDLAAQTALLADATASRRRGSNAEAVAAYERLIARYPTSPLAETAYAERMRLLAKTDRPRAAAAARDYLARFPRGYAHDEAASLAASP